MRAHTGLRKSVEISADSLELHRRHLDSSGVVCVRNGQVFLVNVHELDVILANPVGLRALEHELDNVRRVLRLQGQDIFILGGAEHLGQGDQVDTESDVAVAAVGRESLSLEHHRDESNVGVVHSLEGNAGVIAVEVAVLNEILDCIDDLRRREMD